MSNDTPASTKQRPDDGARLSAKDIARLRARRQALEARREQLEILVRFLTGVERP